MKRLFGIFLLISGLISQAGTPSKKEEGMYPLSLLQGLGLQAAGLQIPLSELYNPNGVSLVDALVRLGGCTGSFISAEGLIISNHHCVFGSVAAVSTAEKNYLEHGFYAASRDQEIKTGLKVRITQSYEDVSNLVLKDVNDDLSPAARADKIRSNIGMIEAEQRALYPDLEIEISEMFVGKFYTLFRYKNLNDIRLVYVPPRSVGEFGGESDNWVWPRHNADFSMVRAYEDGKPFVPKKFLPIDKDGVKENDFAFILGYPGRTYRHQPAQYLQMQYEHILPFISDWYDYKINVLENAGKNDVNKALSYASTIKSYANVTKNFKGKIQGLTRTSILEDKFQEQDKLKSFAANNPGLTAKYEGYFDQLDALYSAENRDTRKLMILSQLLRSSGAFYLASVFSQWEQELKLKPKKEHNDWLESQSDAMDQKIKSNYIVYSKDIDRQFMTKLITYLLDLNDVVLDALLAKHSINNIEDAEKTIARMYDKTRYTDTEGMLKSLGSKRKKTILAKDALKPLANDLYAYYLVLAREAQERNNTINALLPKLVDLKLAYYKNTFVPDANGTLRFTYGYIKGYWPDDAVYHKPFTTLKGILEKARPEGDYFLESEYLETYKTVEASDNLKVEKGGEVVVGMLYNMDTTGGNSGSPIMNAKGELIGVNFDRAFTATINDFAWNESYSRSIGVDIRFVIYVLQHIGKADSVLEELGING